MHRLTNPARFFGAYLIAFMLTACAQLGLTKAPETVNQQVAVGIASVTAVRQTATTLLASGKISVADARNVQTQADAAREGLDLARTFSGTDMATAEAKLLAAQRVLTALQTYLATKQGK